MKLYISILALGAMFLAVGCQKKEGAADSSSSAKADSMKAAYKAVSEAWDAGKVDEFDKYITANSVDHNAMPGQKPGLAGMKEFAAQLKTAFPDMKSTIDDIRVDGDMLVARFTMTGTNSGPMMGMPATNKKVSVMGIDEVKWDNGKFTDHWGAMEEMKMMTQLGMMPPMGAPPAGGDMAKPAEDGKMEKPMMEKKGK